jgi:integrase/recombinase XerD
MASFKLTMRETKGGNAEEHPIYVRVTINRKSKFKSTKIKLLKADWDSEKQNVKRSTQNYSKLSHFFDKQKLDLQNRILDLQMREVAITHENIWQDPRNENNEFGGDLIKFAEAYLEEEMKRRNISQPDGTLRGWWSKLERLKKHSPTLNIHNTTESFLQAYKDYLANEVEDISTYSTVYGHLKFLRKIWKLALRKEITKNYPFKHFPLTEPEYAEKDYLDRVERNAFMDLVGDENLPPT